MFFPNKSVQATIVFSEGNPVVLVAGTYIGATGTFLRFRPDTRWAEITERDGLVKSHPVGWLAHAKAADADSAPQTLHELQP